MKKLYVFMSFCLLFTLCGCAGYREIDRGYIVTAIGFSSKNDSTTIFIEALSSSDVTDQKSERVVLSGSGNNLQQAYKKLKSTLVKPLYFEHLGTAVFEGEITQNLEFVNKIPNINYGIYLVKTDDIKSLFENETPNGVLGYDVITLIKTQEKDKKVKNQLYKAQLSPQIIPVVNFIDGNLVLKQAGDK